MHIRVAAGEPVPADSAVLRAHSSCARVLPADASEWDVSGLLFDGKPFTRETVSCWLRCAQNFLDGSADLDAQDTQQLSTVTGLTQVLAFADAVGSRSGLCKALCSQLQQLKFVVQLPEQVLELPVAGFCYGFDPGADRQLVQATLQQFVNIGARLPLADCHYLKQQLATQTAALLELAHVLRLQQLLDVLHRFIQINAWPRGSFLLSDVAGLVFTGAVLEAALGSSSALTEEAYVSSVLSQPCSLTPGNAGDYSLIKPVGEPTWDASTKCLEFDAQLLRDFAGGRAGDPVVVSLDLFGTNIKKARGMIMLQHADHAEESHGVGLPVQLLLGYNFPDAAALKDFLQVNPPE